VPALMEVSAASAVRTLSVESLTGTTLALLRPSDRSLDERATTAQTHAVKININSFILCYSYLLTNVALPAVILTAQQ
jgi:hypothetical protein